MSSKKYSGKPCGYCGCADTNRNHQAEHVLFRQLFVVARIQVISAINLY